MIYCLTRTPTHMRIHTRATLRDMEEMFPCDDMSLRARVLNMELNGFFFNGIEYGQRLWGLNFENDDSLNNLP